MLRKKIKIAAIISAVTLLLATAVLTVYAYFTTVAYVYTEDGDKQVAHLGMNLSLLFDKLKITDDNTLVDDTTQLPFIQSIADDGTVTYYTYDKDAKWGTAQNPYVISDIRHLQNLSALQDIGYFYDLIIVENFDANGNYTANSNNKPYFLVCTPDGTPTTINGTGIEIKPIGNEIYPFIGEIAGAPVTKDANDNTLTTTVPVKDGLTSDTSAIYNITIKSKRERPDHGIFGYVSYLGDMPEDYNTSAGTFNGYVSRIQGLLMADVSLVVHRDNLVEDLLDDVTTWIGEHVLSYTALSESEQSSVPHETHHIGILAGHVDYVDVTNISVYYSSDDIVCIDLNDDQAGVNYFSSTGIIGYVYSMNPQYDGNTIYIGTGSSSSGLGSLGGGGSASGVNPGYVLAKEMYTLYSPYSKQPILTTDGLSTYKYGSGDNEVYLGVKINVTVDVNSQNQPTIYYMDELGHVLNPSGTDPDRTWTYQENGQTKTLNLTLPNNAKATDKKYFYSQIEITGQDADGNNVYAPVYYSTITGIEDGIAVGDPMNPNLSIELRVLEKTSDLYLYSAKDKDGKNVCAQWYRKRLLLGDWLGMTEATGRYYFYDGVFTFALSSMRDVIKEIWPANSEGLSTVPFYTLAGAEEWTEGKIDIDTYHAILTPVTSNDDISSDKVYMLAFEGVLTNGAKDYFFMNMMTGGSGDNGQFGQTSLTNMMENGKYSCVIDSDTGVIEIELGRSDDGVDALNGYSFMYSATNQTIFNVSDSNTRLGIMAEDGVGSAVYYVYSGAAQTPGDDDGDWSVLNPRPNYSYSVLLTVGNDGKATVRFNSFKYYAYAVFGGESTSTSSNMYLGYSTMSQNTQGNYTGQNSFTTTNPTTSAGSAGKFNLYEVEIKHVRIEGEQTGLVPKDDATNTVEDILYANQYVLYPQGANAVVGGAAVTSEDPIYALIDVSKLGYDASTEKGTWRYASGSLLADLPDGLKYVFDLKQGAKYGSVTSNVLGGDWDGGDAFVKATLGTDGSETFIPMGCISFKVNKDPVEGDPIKIRVIVAVPTSSVPNGLSYEEDYYFAIWQNDVAAGQNQQFNFAEDGALQKFELPRSQPLYDTNGNRVDNNAGSAISVQYDANGNGVIDAETESTVYTTYFQGETVLVAYEFTVTEKGVYTLGATNGPMQIVYFSADGVASLGRDGTGGAYLQGIDFVYDTVDYADKTSNKIVTVTTQIPDNQNADVENYNYYYESSCILRFDNNVQHNNQFVSIWHEKIYVRRFVNDEELVNENQKTQLNFKVAEGTELSTIESNRYVKCEPYAIKSDKVVTTYTVTQGSPPTSSTP